LRKKLPIFYSAIILTAVNLLLRFAGTSFQVYLSGRIGAAGIGLLQLVMSVGALAMTAGMAGVRTASMYLTAEELGRKHIGNIRWVLSCCGGYSLLCSFGVSLCLYCLSTFLATNWIGNSDTATALRLFAYLLPLQCLCGVMTGYFTAANRIAALAGVEIAEQLCSMAVTVILLQFWAGTDPVKACLSVILGSGAAAVLTLFCLTSLRFRERVQAGPKIRILSRLLKIAVPLALADDLKAGISTAENLMVPRRLALYPAAADPLAAFGIVTGMVFPVMMFPAAILYGLAELLLPELARCAAVHSKIRIEYLVKRSLKVALLYGCLFAGLMFLLSEPLCTALYQNAEAGIRLKCFSLLIPMLYCDAITDAMTKGLGQQKACVRYNIITSLLDVILLYILLPQYGMTGYFFSFLVTHALNFALSIARLFKISGYIPNIKIPIWTALSCLTAILLAATVQTPLMRAFCFLLLYGAMLTLFHVIGKEDILWFKGLLYKK